MNSKDFWLAGLLGLFLFLGWCLAFAGEFAYWRLRGDDRHPSPKRAFAFATGLGFFLCAWVVYVGEGLWFVSTSDHPPAAMPAGPTESRRNPVDNALRKLLRGSAFVVSPSEVKQYARFDVSLYLEKGDLAPAISAAKATTPEGFSISGIENVRLSPRMKAELLGDDFVIESKGPLEQAVTLAEPTTWKWSVRGELPGSRRLTVRLHTLIKVDGQEASRVLDVAEMTISVKVDAREWALRHWEWIATAIVLPFVGWAVKQMLDARKLADKAPSTGTASQTSPSTSVPKRLRSSRRRTDRVD